MFTLLLSATEFEINPTHQWLNDSSLANNDSKAELLIGGIGQLQTAWSLTRRLQNLKPALVIQAGIGGYPIREAIGEVFAIGSERIADLGLLGKTGFSDMFEMGLDKPDRFPFSGGKLVNPYVGLLELSGLPVAEGVTVNEIKSDSLPDVQRNPLPVVESMEGAALHYVCLMEKIPFLQIRAVSNVTGERDKSRWKIKEAISNLNSSLIALIQKFEKADETLFRI